MPRPTFGQAKERGFCASCGDMVMVPPGVYYRGDIYHKGCARLLVQQDFDEEVTEPYMDAVEDSLQSLMENMGPMSEG